MTIRSEKSFSCTNWFARAVAFDMDGLMFDTEAVYWKAASALLKRRGFEYTQTICDEIMGRPPEYCFKRFIEIFSLKEDWRDLRREDEELFIDFLKEGYATTPGLLELLDVLERRGIPRCVCTSSSARVANEVLKKDDVISRFSFVLTSDDVTKGKPNPDVYLKAATRFGINPKDMLVLEDSSAGCRAAVDSGATCCMLRARHNVNADFSRATAVVDRLDAPNLLTFL